MKTIVVRSLSGLVYVILVFLCTTNYLADILNVYFNVKIHALWFYYALMTLFLVGCMIETMRMLTYSSFIYKILTFALAGIIYYSFTGYYFHNSFSYSLFSWRNIFLLILFFLSVITLFRYPAELSTDSAKLIFTAVYLGVPFSLSLVIPLGTHPLTSEVFFVFFLLWVSDSFAYLVGSRLGRRKLAPKISPNKSVEGLIGGIIGTVLAGIVIEYFYSELKGNWIVISLIISIFAPIGDLAESKLKRMFNVKDSGSFMPGHGGILDRLDSFIFCIPVIFAYYLLIA